MTLTKMKEDISGIRTRIKGGTPIGEGNKGNKTKQNWLEHTRAWDRECQLLLAVTDTATRKVVDTDIEKK